MDTFSFTLERNGRNQILHYEEPGHTLALHLDASASPRLDWLLCDNDLAGWTAPAQKAITAAKRKEIVDRLGAWALGQRLKIGLGPCYGSEGYLQQLEREGWRDQMSAKGGVTYCR